MRIQLLGRTSIPLFGMTCLLVMACSGFVAGQASKGSVVAAVVPQGNDFRIQFDEEQVSKAYPQYTAAQAANGRRTQPISKNEFKDSLQKEALSKLRTLFPNGVPPDTVGRIKISIYITLRPPGGGVSIEW